ncbi:MAG TPA: VOC family protein [Verrucomicrobiae bacterium]|nr:VOC family protein [Verrucomicrobiae bacterium]
MGKMTTYITFVNDKAGKAEEAVKFYVSVFKNSKLDSLLHYKEGEYGGDKGMVKFAQFTLNGQEFFASENNEQHVWNASPAVSIFVECDSVEEIDELYEKLSEGGDLMLPLDDYGFSEKYAWFNDKYGTSWQLNVGKMNLASEASEV